MNNNYFLMLKRLDSKGRATDVKTFPMTERHEMVLLDRASGLALVAPCKDKDGNINAATFETTGNPAHFTLLMGSTVNFHCTRTIPEQLMPITVEVDYSVTMLKDAPKEKPKTVNPFQALMEMDED